MCANPIVPADWNLTYPAFIYAGDKVSLQLTIHPSVDLPTKPIIK